MLAPSPFTRKKFREFQVGTTLGYIGDVFDDAGTEMAPPGAMSFLLLRSRLRSSEFAGEKS
ncbi:MAG: hypothetical protein LH654_12645 [Thermoleophilia bacterium]|nr:hypothetical protein [Thermoleophilia bacterium]